MQVAFMAFAGLDLDKLNISQEKAGRRGPVSRKSASNFQEKRRREALLRQQQARQACADCARQLALSAEASHENGDEDLGVEGQSEVPSSVATGSSNYSKQLLQPEWLVDIPENLHTEWYVMPRPEGQRCLVIASQGRTVSRLRNGAKLHQFPSHLPGGSRMTLSGPEDFSILDCIFSGESYYILDVMCWKGYSMYDCSAEFRLFWRDSKVREDLEAAAGPSRCGRYKFEFVPAYTSNPDGLKAAHSGKVPFERDGCFFCHKECRYDPDGPTPLALFWKDPKCSRFCVDTDMHGTVPHHQHVVLQVTDHSDVSTGDSPPIVLGSVPMHVSSRRALWCTWTQLSKGWQMSCSSNQAYKLALYRSLLEKDVLSREGKLLKFSIREGGIQLANGAPVHVDLHFEGTGNQRRGRADIWSKILFQHLARTSPLLLSHLLSGQDSLAGQEEVIMH